MRAAVLVGPARVDVQRVPVPIPDEGEVLVRTRMAAICGSDLHTVFGPREREFPGPPGYPGHEGLGQVVESRSPAFRPGARVLTVPTGDHARCFADLQVVPDSFLVPLPEGPAGELLMAQQLGTVIHALKRFWPEPPADTALVVGAGSAGLHFVQLLKRRGFGRVIAADLVPHRLRMARELGADDVLLASEVPVAEATLELTGGRGADLVVEAAGRDRARFQAMRAVAHDGRVGFFGLPETDGEATFPFAQLFQQRPLLVFSVGTQLEPGLASFREAVELIAQGRVDVRRHLTHRFPIDDIARALALARWREDGAIKVAITFD
jgi:L-iditol 2-dehydrogenase